MDKDYAGSINELERRILAGPGTLDPQVRLQAAARSGLADELAEYIEKVHLHAYKIDEADIDALRAAGYTEDQIFELTVAAAYGAARLRLDAGLAALGPATDGGRAR